MKDDKDSWSRMNAEEALEKLKNTNELLLDHYPNIVCTGCYLRPQKETVRIGIIKRFSYVVCRGCGCSLHLITGAYEVIGLIELSARPLSQDVNKVYLSLYSSSDKKARNADIDLLEIREPDIIKSDMELQYKWAINAVIKMLKSDVSRPPYYLKTKRVIIKGNCPIPDGSRKMLWDEFKEVRVVS